MPNRSPTTSLTLLKQMQRPETREAAWAAFVGRYESVLRAWASREGFDGAAADDLVAIVLTKLLHALPTYDGERPFRPWLRTIVRNAACDLHRALRRTPGAMGSGETAVAALLAELPDEADPLGPMIDGLATEHELARRVAAAVAAQVNPKHWEAFLLTQVDATLDGEQIARRLGLPSRQAVYQAVYRVRRLVQAEFERLGGGAAPGR